MNPFYFLVHQFYVIYLPYILNLMIPNTGSSKYAVFKRYQLTVFDLIKASFQNISCVHVYFFLMHKVTVKGEAKQMENSYRFFPKQGKHTMVALQKLIL